MPPRKRAKEPPWWHSPTIEQIYVTPKAIRRCKLPALIIQRISSCLADQKYPTRPRRARRNWLEELDVDGVRVKLSCVVERELLVITNIELPRGGFERIKRKW